MTVTDTKPVSGPFLSDGAKTTFEFTFKIFDASQIALRITDADGSNGYTETDDISVDPMYLDSDTGGYLTYTPAGNPLPLGKVIFPYRAVPYTQPNRIGNQGRFNPETHEETFDLLEMQIQQLREEVTRAAKVDVGENPLSIAAGIRNGHVLQVIDDLLAEGPSVDEIANAGTYAAQAKAARDEVLAVVAGSGLKYSLRTFAPVGWVFGTDDTAIVQTALTFMQVNGGGILYLPIGDVRIKKCCTVSGATVWIIGQGGSDAAGRGSRIVVDTAAQPLLADKTGLRFLDADMGGMEKLCITGPDGTARLNGGQLVEVGTGTFGFFFNECVIQRGYNGVWFYGGLFSAFTNTRIRTCSGDYHIASLPGPDGRAWQGIVFVDSDLSASRAFQFLKYTGSRVFSIGAFLADPTRVKLTRKSKLYAETELTYGTDYTVAFTAAGITVTIAAGVTLATGDYIEFEDQGGVRGRGPTLALFDGRSASNKFINFTGGFGGDGFLIINTTNEGGSGAFYFANGGLENIHGTAFRAESGADYKFVNIYFAGEEHCIHMVRDTAGTQNIQDVYQTAFDNTISIRSDGHGFAADSQPLVSGVQGVPQANGRWNINIVNENRFELVSNVETGDPSQWLLDPDDDPPVYTAGTGNVRTRVAGQGGFTAVNSLFRASRKSAVLIDAPFCRMNNCKVTSSGSGDKGLPSKQVTALSASGTGRMVVDTKRKHRLDVGDLVRIANLKKAGAKQLTDIYGSVITVNSPTRVTLSATGMNNAGQYVSMDFNGPYDAMPDTAPVLLYATGANIELGPGADCTDISHCALGDINSTDDITPYGLWNKSTNQLTVTDNDCTGNKKKSIRNDTVSVAVVRHIWRDNQESEFNISVLDGSGSPEGVVVATPGSTYKDKVTGLQWAKVSGVGNTGWSVPSLTTEGTWNVGFTFDTPGDLVPNITASQCFYSKTGKMVRIWGEITFQPVHTTASGKAKLTGLPFRPDGNQALADIAITQIVGTGLVWSPYTQVSLQALNTAENVLVFTGKRTANPSGQMTFGNFTSNQPITIRFDGTYRALA